MTNLILVGCGKMGTALLDGWLAEGTPAENITVIEPNAELAEDLAARGVKVLESLGGHGSYLTPSVVLLAVKPQMMDQVVPAYQVFSGDETVFLSIAAGKTLGYFESRLGDDAAIVRAMPNTPAAVGRGITVCCGNERVGPEQQRLCHDLLEAVGEVHWVDDEGLMDPVTALSGGGPAYVFLLAEVLADAGVEAGLERDLAERLARVTVSGAGELMRQSSEPASRLRENVTSPGGTTAEALKVLMMEEAWPNLAKKAIRAATARSKELAG
ncbi:MAG: pyrroline-5-carboxylate reductase [Magnetovibrionaceae bacterium]